MSFSTLMEMEACPRRWALNAAVYPDLWKSPGYPRLPNSAAMEGTLVHLSLQTIMVALVERGCSSLLDESAISVLRELGGYTAITLRSLEQTVQPYEQNPRAAPLLAGIRRRLSARVPVLRSKVQRFLSRIRPEGHSDILIRPATQTRSKSRRQLAQGSHAEVELRAPNLGWRGFADLLNLSAARCEIRDFKTGDSKRQHELQLQIYALLWAQDRDLNPTGRFADELVLSYSEGDVNVAAPSETELHFLEQQLRERSISALASVKEEPPAARPSTENCEFCAVRHLCEDYWNWLSRTKIENDVSSGRFSDLQIKLSVQHGPNSWDGEIEVGSNLRVGGPVFLRTSNSNFDLRPRQRLRILNVRLSVTEEEPIETQTNPVVATMGANSEIYLLSK